MIDDPQGRIDYEERGAGPTIVFVPGSWGTGSAWRGVIAALPDRFRFVTTSLLGYGNTVERRTAKDSSIDHEAEVVEAVIRKAGGAVHLVGHSYGGLVCLLVARRGDAPLASLTVIEPTSFGLLQSAGEVELNRQVLDMSSAYAEAYRDGEMEAGRRVIDFYGGEGCYGSFPQRMREFIVATTPANILDWISVPDFDRDPSVYARLDAPTLVMRGGTGHPAMARTAELVSQAIPGSTLATIPGASHFAIATHAPEVATLIVRHVDAAASEAPPSPRA